MNIWYIHATDIVCIVDEYSRFYMQYKLCYFIIYVTFLISLWVGLEKISVWFKHETIMRTMIWDLIQRLGGDVPSRRPWVFQLGFAWEVVVRYLWGVVKTFQCDIAETYHWDVLATYRRDVVGCFIWD